jgi:FkbM family methyltransferase
MHRLFGRLIASLRWRYCLLVKRGRIVVDGKLLDGTTPLINRSTFKYMMTGNYEVAERRLLAYMVEAGHICRGDLVLEAGGGLGVLTMKIADIVGDDSIVVFEANPRTASALQVNLALNEHAIKVEIRALVADANAEVALADLIDANAGFGSCSTHRVESGVSTITVPAETLVDALRRIDPTVLVIDVEGAEHDLLASVRDWRRLRSIHMEVHPDVLPAPKIAAMLRRLAEDGFRVVESPISDVNVMLLSRSAGDAGNVVQRARL